MVKEIVCLVIFVLKLIAELIFTILLLTTITTVCLVYVINHYFFCNYLCKEIIEKIMKALPRMCHCGSM